MFTDMVGYTALAQKDESLALSIVDDHRKLVRPIFNQYEGREIKTIGDGFLVEFPSALNAVRCAYEIQKATRHFNESRPHQRRVHLRIGVHVGDVVDAEGDISGDAVNITSRIESLAEDGGVCLTRQVYDHVENKFEHPLKSLGPRSLKNVRAPLEVYRMQMPWEESGPAETGVLDRRRIAVLPFASMSPDPNDEYFADGITEEIIATVSNIRNLAVISRTSVMQYKGTKKNLTEIGRELRAGSVLEGSVRKSGNRVRITVQLLDAVEDKHLWAESYDRQLRDVFSVQSEISERVAKALELRMSGEERHRLEGRESKNTEALILYMKGRSLYREQTETSLRKAIEYFQRAVEQDPNFALAYVGLADCHYSLAGGGMTLKSEGLAKAKENLDTALKINPEIGEAHSLLGSWRRYELKWEEAEEEFKKALSLSPSYPNAHAGYAGLLISVGRLDEALDEARKAQELDPLSPLAGFRVGQAFYYRREYDKAIEQWSSVMRTDPNYHLPLLWISFAQIATSKMEDAAAMIFKWADREGDLPGSPANTKWFLAVAHWLLGQKGKAEALKTEAENLEKAPPTYYAYWHMFNGDKDKAFESLEKACDEQDSILFDIKVDPLWDPLRSDPRYSAILQKLRLGDSITVAGKNRD